MTRFADKKILVIDDDENCFMLYEAVLKRAGYREIRHAADGWEGVRAGKEWGPDLIISDIQHGGTDVFEIFRELFAYPKTMATRFIIITGYLPKYHPELVQKAKATGVSKYVVKPIDAKALAPLVDEVFGEVEEQEKKGL